MSTVRVCATHVRRLRAHLISCGAGGLLPPEREQADYTFHPFDPDLLTLAVAFVIVRSMSRGLHTTEMAQIEAGACAACVTQADGWLPEAASHALKTYTGQAPIGGNA